MTNLYQPKRKKNKALTQLERYEGKTRFIKGKTWLSILIIILVLAILEAFVWAFHAQAATVDMWNQTLKYAAPRPIPTPMIQKPTTEQQQIIAYINEVFGSHAKEAFLLLSCENKALRPDAVNTAGNYPEGSRDIGIFQINEYWQKTQGKFLFNPRVNIEIAHQLYVENGNSFKLWSCAKKVGLE